MKKYLFLAFTFLTLCSLAADNPASPAARDVAMKPIRHTPTPIAPPAEIAGGIEKFFKSLKDGNVQSGYEDFLKGTRLLERTENLNQFVEKTNVALGIYGKVLNYELIDTQTVGSAIVVYTYLTYSQLKPLRWRLVYYKPEKNWALSNLSFDDSFEDMIE
jgi:hypothetical protein